MSLRDELARLQRIREEYEAQDANAPAWLVTLGLEDLRAEEELIRAEMAEEPAEPETQE